MTGEALQHPQRHCTVDHVAKGVPPLTSTLNALDQSKAENAASGFKLPPNRLLIFFRAWLAACLGASRYHRKGAILTDNATTTAATDGGTPIGVVSESTPEPAVPNTARVPWVSSGLASVEG